MQKRKVYTQWKQDQVTREEFRDAACYHRGKIGAVKSQLELHLARNIWDNKKSFFKYINGNRQYRNITSLSQDEDGHLRKRGRDKAEVFNAFFASVFNIDYRPKGSQCSELEDHDNKNDQLPVNPEILCDLLLQLDSYKSMEPDGIHPRILKLLMVDIFTKALLMTFEWSWKYQEVPAD
ncbi:rna-directed dna polymerase from mobile element jockey-like [Willisornis vidua]|uniref:Rna-directed dna polymerase from mobile element jockey-like n=1 Tax=Willisornis vidua TaxID=1566151 RepID=A0ABQ9DMJ1_9PASS|nr:rna-directed dna polymerase from mobile element jockey-like [Willisornis vidua]